MRFSIVIHYERLALFAFLCIIFSNYWKYALDIMEPGPTERQRSAPRHQIHTISYSECTFVLRWSPIGSVALTHYRRRICIFVIGISTLGARMAKEKQASWSLCFWSSLKSPVPLEINRPVYVTHMKPKRSFAVMMTCIESHRVYSYERTTMTRRYESALRMRFLGGDI